MSKPRIILAEDHVLVAEGIAKLLNDEFDLISSVSNGRDLLEQVRQHHPEVILVDLSLPNSYRLGSDSSDSQKFPLHSDYYSDHAYRSPFR